MSHAERLQELYLRYMFQLIADGDGEHLHFGLFRGEGAGDLAAAQHRYAEQLVKSVPPTARVLDVGCGRGGIARLLSERGCRVTAISPDPEHVAATQKRDARIDARQVAFERFSSDGEFDVVLFAESFAFFAEAPRAALDRAADLLAPGGLCIIADLMSEDVSEALRDHGAFEILEREDITEDVAPTVAILETRLRRHALPFFELIRHTVAEMNSFAGEELELCIEAVDNQALQALFRGELAERERLQRSRYLHYELRSTSA